MLCFKKEEQNEIRFQSFTLDLTEDLLCLKLYFEYCLCTISKLRWNLRGDDWGK